MNFQCSLSGQFWKIQEMDGGMYKTNSGQRQPKSLLKIKQGIARSQNQIIEEVHESSLLNWSPGDRGILGKNPQSEEQLSEMRF